MAEEKNGTRAKKAIRVPLKFRIPENIVTRFASNIVVQTIENEFKISFFEIKPEIRLFPQSPQNAPKDVLADCVASVIVTAEKMPSFISALQNHFDRFKKDKETGNKN
ncbi:MAG: hypothetical protein A2Y69_09330 [Candidatus Aminicenantes bacterium RBG_13_59_9]|nr:MAG: hypothetical protein A2Y69_09330 [Candidatus Aminicenantes bacterium RBG_13_59_9]